MSYSHVRVPLPQDRAPPFPHGQPLPFAPHSANRKAGMSALFPSATPHPMQFTHIHTHYCYCFSVSPHPVAAAAIIIIMFLLFEMQSALMLF